MHTVNKVIEYVDRVKPNAYGEEEKYRWLSELDGMVRRVVMQEPEVSPYRYPDDGDTELLVPYPFNEVYPLYMMAMIDLHNKEYAAYNNSVMTFNTKLDEYKKAYIREHLPKSAGYQRNI